MLYYSSDVEFYQIFDYLLSRLKLDYRWEGGGNEGRLEHRFYDFL